jgi:hypothetical protein
VGSLDSYAQAVANNNGGILNVAASAAATVTVPGNPLAPPALMEADADTPLQVGASALYWLGQPPDLVLSPVAALNQDLPPLPQTYDPASPGVPGDLHYMSEPENTVTSGGRAVDVNLFAINGIDYSKATPADNCPGCVPDNCGQIYWMSQKVMAPIDVPVVLGEAHAYYDAKATWTYSRATQTGMEIGFSADNHNWGIASSVEFNRSYTSTSGLYNPQGPYYGHQEAEIFRWLDYKINYQCQNTGQRFSKYRIVPTQWRGVWQESGDVSNYDGGKNFYKSNKDYRQAVNPNGGFTNDRGNGYRYSFAFNAAGFSAGAYADHSAYVSQSITALSRPFVHDIWGNDRYPNDGSQIFYSY